MLKREYKKKCAISNCNKTGTLYSHASSHLFPQDLLSVISCFTSDINVCRFFLEHCYSQKQLFEPIYVIPLRVKTNDISLSCGIK